MTEETVRCDFQAGGISQMKEAFRTQEQALMRLEKLAARCHDAEEKGALSVLKTERATSQARVKSAAAMDDARVEIAKRSAEKRLAGEKALFAGLEKLEKEHTAKVVAESKKREAAEAAVAKRRGQMGSAIGGGVARTLGMAKGSYGGLAAGMGVGIGASFALADAARGYMSSEAAAINLANSMYNPNDPDPAQKNFLAAHGKNGRFDKKKLMDFAREASIETGVDKTAFLTGAQDYIAKSSDWTSMATDSGKGKMKDLAKLAVGSGTDFGQLMSAAGSLKVQNPNLGDERMMEMMRNIVGQGKMGAVEIKDLAQHASVITAGAGKYKIGAGGYKDQSDAQNALLGLSQIAIRTSGSAAEAATAVKDFSADIGSHADKAQKNFAGLQLKDKDGQLLRNSAIIENLFNATGGDVSKMGAGKGHVGLGRESIRIVEALKTQFDIGRDTALSKGASKADATKAGAKAAAAEVTKFESAGYSKGDVERDHAEVVAGAGKRIEMASARIRESLEVKMAPVVERLADAFVKNEKGLTSLANALATVADFLTKNPFEGIGLILAAAVTKEIAVAAIGEGIKTAMEIPKVRGAAGQLAGSLGILSIAVIAIIEGMKLIDAAIAKKAAVMTKNATSGTNILEERAALMHKVEAGTATKEDLAKARQQLEAGKADLANQKTARDEELGSAGHRALSLVDKDAAAVQDKAQADAIMRTAQSLASFEAAIMESHDAIKAHNVALREAAASAANPSNPNRNAPLGSAPRGGTEK